MSTSKIWKFVPLFFMTHVTPPSLDCSAKPPGPTTHPFCASENEAFQISGRLPIPTLTFVQEDPPSCVRQMSPFAETPITIVPLTISRSRSPVGIEAPVEVQLSPAFVDR